MAQKLQQQLREVGSKLQGQPASKDALIKLLKQAENCLSELEQSPPPSLLSAMKPCVDAIAKEDVLKHQDRDVRVLVAACICEITRITAPEAPYSDDVLRDIFDLIVSTFSGLKDANTPSFKRTVIILETLARYRSCVVMLDLECYDLINDMFQIFFNVVSDDHPNNVRASMQTIMVLIIEESEDIQENLLVTILSPLGRKRNGFTMAARKLAMNVIEHCAGKLEPSIRHFLVSSMSGDSSYLESSLDYHEVIYDLYQCVPQILFGIISFMTAELLTDKLEIRQKAVQLLGDLFALSGIPISESFKPLFSEFVKRLADRVADIRVSVIGHLKNYLMLNTSRAEAPLIIKALSDRLLDYDENVRKHVVAAICDLACHSVKVIPVDTVKTVAERLRDKSLSVKLYTMERLAELYRCYCLKRKNDLLNDDDSEWIPGRVLRCLYDKDFRSETIEFILCGSLFSHDLTIRDRVKHWIKVFSTFDKVELKALEQILLQKQRLQQEFQKYLTLRQTQQDDFPEIQKKYYGLFRMMSRMFHDAAKAEEGFQMLNQLKDPNIWKLMMILLDPGTGFCQAWSCRGELLKILGEKHSLYEFIDMLSVKCSYLLFNKELVKEIILESAEQKSTGDAKFILSCMDLLTVIASFSPHLFIGCEDDLLHLLKEDNDIIKEGITRVLAKAGGTIREQLAMTSGPVDLVLERLCLEGTRKQAKYSVHAIAAITKDDGLKSLSVLYKRLVDMLEKKTHLPSILQSLGCIAQIAMPVFETRENEIVEFISKKVLKRKNDMPATSDNSDWNERSEFCSLKMLGIKTLVKSYLPVKDASSRTGIDKLMALLRNVLAYGDISKDVESSAVDKAHMRLIAAKSVLRLSRLWDHMIPLDVFYITLRISEDVYPQFRTIFINKVHQYIKDRLLDAKYACAFLLNINQYQSPEYKEAKHFLLEVVQICQQLKLRQISMQNDVSSSVMYPESILVYLVHALAHHPSCPNINECTELSAFEPIYWRLHLFLSVLLLGDDGWQSGACSDRGKDSYAAIVAIFRSIKCSEDATDCARSRTSHALSDLGLSITKKLVPDQADVSELANTVSLPASLYKAYERDEESSRINGEQSWLSGESALAHFEALMFEDKEQILSDFNKDSILLGEKDKDDNDVPLGKMMKLLKSHGTKKKKTKTQTSTFEMKRNDEEVDVLGMVREINLDTIKAAKGMENSSQKRKLSDATNSIIPPTPKRKRSSTIHSSPSSNRDMKQHVSSVESELLRSSLPKIQSTSRRGEKKGVHSGETIINDVKNHSILEGSDKKGSGGSAKKRKVRSISGLSKCSSKKTQLNGKLVGSRIKVWWPLDKTFYEGVVHSYDPGNKKHSILYDDGDVEVLQLEREKWEHIPNGCTPKKRSKSHQSSSHEQLSLDINDDSIDYDSQGNKKPTKRSAGSNHGGRHVSGKGSQSNVRRVPKNDVYADKSKMDIKRDSEVPDAHPHSGSEIDDVNLELEVKESYSPTEIDDKTKANTLELPKESMKKIADVLHLKTMEDSDDEPLSLWKQRAGKTG
ncbi:sister chromatid cohesion protein PDS5 homolog A [Phalaenopsis equestris]|uniref:sister chromatid cohesion protein PDS5 homolog A n=1 Tax=Phalaenopsis equestris TaxID=78828 RepID=UPI0009E3CBAF|nr:sister chromatid cohesion protein PDS5 homolog A [Phalaenopsis equestris]